MDIVRPDHPGPSRILALATEVQPAEYILHSETCTIGRSDQCDIVIARTTISRVQARILCDDGRWVLYDNDSANGTFVNRQRLSHAHLLHHNDTIGLSDATSLLRFVEPIARWNPALVGICYDERAATFWVHQTLLHLTPSQARLLLHLYRSSDQLCTRESCALAIWGRKYDPLKDADALERTIANLRQRLHYIAPEITLNLAW